MAIDGEALKILRERDGWTAKAFADKVGISPQYLSSIEKSKRHNLKRRPDLIKKMAAILAVPVTMLTHNREDEAA